MKKHPAPQNIAVGRVLFCIIWTRKRMPPVPYTVFLCFSRNDFM